MTVFSFVLVGLLLVILQTTVFMIHPVWLLAPDFYFILVAYLAYRFDLLRALIIIFPLASMLDVLSGAVLGMYAMLCFGGFFLLRLMAARMPVQESYYQVPLVGVSYLALSWCVYMLLNLFGPVALIPWSWPRMLVRAGLVVLFSFPLFRFFNWLDKRLQSRISPLTRLRIRSGNRFRKVH